MVHRITCSSVQEHIARDIAEGTVRWTLTEVEADFAAERELVGPDPFETPRSYADVMGRSGTRIRFVSEATDPVTAAKGRSEAMDRAAWGDR